MKFAWEISTGSRWANSAVVWQQLTTWNLIKSYDFFSIDFNSIFQTLFTPVERTWFTILSDDIIFGVYHLLFNMCFSLRFISFGHLVLVNMFLGRFHLDHKPVKTIVCQWFASRLCIESNSSTQHANEMERSARRWWTNALRCLLFNV